eukprot:364500-Chlamydomonas_euryale.AAC.26
MDSSLASDAASACICVVQYESLDSTGPAARGATTRRAAAATTTRRAFVRAAPPLPPFLVRLACR